MALMELVSVPSQKLSAALGTGVSLCRFPYLVLSVVCLLVHLFVFKKCFPASGCGDSWISADLSSAFGICKNNVSLAFSPTINRQSRLVPNSKGKVCTFTSSFCILVSTPAVNLVV